MKVGARESGNFVIVCPDHCSLLGKDFFFFFISVKYPSVPTSILGNTFLGLFVAKILHL